MPSYWRCGEKDHTSASGAFTVLLISMEGTHSLTQILIWQKHRSVFRLQQFTGNQKLWTQLWQSRKKWKKCKLTADYTPELTNEQNTLDFHILFIFIYSWDFHPWFFFTFKMSRDKFYVCARVCMRVCVWVWPRGCRRRWFWAGCDWRVCPRPLTLRWVCVETRSCGCSWGSDSSEIYGCSPIWESQSDRPPRSPPPHTPPASELTHRALTSLHSPSHRVH